MKKTYIALARKLDETTLNFLIGLMSGWLINTVTGTIENGWFVAGVICLGVSVLFNFGLQLLQNAIRERFQIDLEQNELNKTIPGVLIKSYDDVKDDAYIYGEYWQHKFLAFFFIAVIGLTGSVFCVVSGKMQVREQDKVKEAQQASAHKAVEQMGLNLKQQRVDIHKLLDKIDSLEQKRPISPPMLLKGGTTKSRVGG